MSEYLRIIDHKMVSHHCGPLPADKDIIEIPVGWPYFTPGRDIREFDSSWHIRPLADRITAKLVTVSKAEKIVGEEVVAKDRLERIRDGIDEAPKGEKLIKAKDGALSLEAMTIEEKVAAKQITKVTGEMLQAAAIRYERNAKYQPSDDAHVRLTRQIRTAEKAGSDIKDIKAELELWDEYAQALADVTDQPGFPWEITWPVRPDGVEV